jgi:NADH-quinone oxidoreductase subunit J
MMELNQLPFYLVSAFILITGLLTVTANKLFRSAIWLLFSLIGIAILYFLMEVEFAAAVQIIVYVGGIVVLIIFSIFLTQQTGADMPAPIDRRKLFSALAVLTGAVFACTLLTRHGWGEPSATPFDPSVRRIGHLLVGSSDGSFVIPFELVSILLLAAMIGCIVIALKSRPEHK